MGSVLNGLWNTTQLDQYQCQERKVHSGGIKILADHQLGSSVDGDQFLNLAGSGSNFTGIVSDDNNHTCSTERYDFNMTDSCQTIPQTICGTDNKNGDESKTDTMTTPMCEDENRLGGPVFDPPLYQQRYSFVADKLNSLNVQSVVDFGCAECQLSRFLADIPSVQRIAMVDMDRPLLQAHKYNIKPAVYHFLDKRKHPLTIQIYHGDATVLDTRIMGYDAVSMVEFVEHLYPIDLQKVCDMVFHELQPRIIIVTTPNFEFNQLFPDDGRTFRHYDHKFEWTRKEFQSWGNQQAGSHGYTVQYTGIGNPPPESNHLGYCSQAAIFERIKVENRVQQNEKCAQSYTQIAEAVYPYKNEEDTMSPSEALSMEARYNIRELIKGDNYLELEPDKVVIRFSELLRYRNLAKMCKNSITILRDHFLDQNFSLTDDQTGIIVCLTDYFETEKFGVDLYDENEDWDLDEGDGSNEVKEVMSSKSDNVSENKLHEEFWD
ncbi:small RNA 2'-O-methyltransferase-like [Mizuhopecten yessoensis]|uniref:small RNA 2'-O-methyltransferase-like n=1 Tax=Mizuhopecten yessoensis TaxID=6573 RepID=UPI000B45EEAA|nr:small RNA 2'-O-methyltransferase-like [Mizuhopecten yessoensis]XP_021357306.1 small RNA 2'-O-methyltransferase-like [Mizuhopecten yessoensis]